MRPATLRVGLVGAGRQMSEYLLPALRQLPGVELTHVCSRRGHSAAELAARWAVAGLVPDWRTMLEADDCPQAIVVAADPSVHAEVASAALRRGIHVFVEKPPAMCEATIRELAALEWEHPNVRACVGYNFEHSAPLLDGLTRLCQVTAPRSLDIRFVSAGPRDPGVYVNVLDRLLWDTLIHPLHLALVTFGAPARISVSSIALASPMLLLRVLVEHEGGCHSSIEVGNHASRFDLDIRVVGVSGATFELEGLSRMRFSGLPGPSIESKEERGLSWPIRRSNAACTGYLPALERFVESIATGASSPSPFASSVTTVVALARIGRQLGTETSAPSSTGIA